MSKFDFTDPTDMMAGPNYRQEGEPTGIVLSFKHVASGLNAQFKAFITDYADSFASAWTPTEVMGRMDDVTTFKNTKRVISVTWTTPSHSEMEAISNLSEIGKMSSMLYPLYEQVLDTQTSISSDGSTPVDQEFIDNEERKIIDRDLDFGPDLTDDQKVIIKSVSDEASERINENIILRSENDISHFPQPVTVISSPPIIQMKFKNWASNVDGSGLYGTLSGFIFKPNFEEGVFMNDGILIPMSCECSAEFTVIHTDKLGFKQNKQIRSSKFPYRVG